MHLLKFCLTFGVHFSQSPRFLRNYIRVLYGRGFAARGTYLSADAHERAHALALDVVLALIYSEIGIARPFAVYAQ